MGANRKLQIEIDRTLKKVQEGAELFDYIWEKVYETDQISLKEKYESDLKKEIKKLQRYRDTIKTWISGSEVKDKSSLIEARKSVERQMERFKICEKETKTKTFSKEGLAQAQKQDPKEKARNEMREWINTTVANLTVEAENYDAEVEALQPSKRKGKLPVGLTHAEESAVRHRAHIQRLEQAIDAEQVQESKELVDDYFQRHEADFDEFACPDDLYVDLLDQLDSLEAQQPNAPNHIGKGTASKDKEAKERAKERNAALAMKLQLAQEGLHVILEDTSPEKLIQPNKKLVHLPPTARHNLMPGARLDTKNAEAQSQDVLLEKQDLHVTNSLDDISVESSPKLAHAPTNALLHGTSTFAAAASNQKLGFQCNQPSTVGLRISTGNDDDSVTAACQDKINVRKVQLSAQNSTVAKSVELPDLKMQNGVLGYQIGRSAVEMKSKEVENQSAKDVDCDEELTDILDFHDTIDIPAVGYSHTHLRLLSASALNCLPSPRDRAFGVLTASSHTLSDCHPSSYPDAQLSAINEKKLFQKLETEALFFAFYYQPGSYHQFLAARELKKQSWRFHREFGAWFQRHEEPLHATDEFEQGTYVYFDYNVLRDDTQSGWCYRLKQDFTFQYDVLEDELHI